MKFYPALLALSVFAYANIGGIVVDEAGNAIQNAVVSVKTLPNLLPDARTLTDGSGKFSFVSNGDVFSIGATPKLMQGNVINVPSSGAMNLSVLDANGKVVRQKSMQASSGSYVLDNAAAMTAGLLFLE